MTDGLDRPLSIGQIVYWRKKTSGDAVSNDPIVFRHHIKEMAGDNLLGLVEKMPYAQDLAWHDVSRLDILRVEEPA